MHFHWMPSVLDFCNETTHIKDAPNPQNLFCNHRSVMEVIQGSPDALSVTAPPPALPEVVINYQRAFDSPLLYLLLDNGRTIVRFESNND
jgi:hypothetical protein